MAELPTGTVTLLFTDIEGSTRLIQEHGDRYADLLIDHRNKLRAVFERNAGVEFGNEGDAFFVAFPKATDAVAAGLESQEALGDGPVRVRIGIHTGEPLVVGSDYVGLDVHRVARICSAAHGGQIVVSDRTRSLLDESFGCRDLGLHRLKDLGTPEKLFQIGSGRFPPLRSLNATNLPTLAAPLIGRQSELRELVALVTECRLVTLTGPGGTGKTRLALHVAAELVDEFEDGVFWVPLAAVTDPELVAPTIASVLGAQHTLPEHIAGKRLLILLDNLEQVLAAAPGLSDLLGGCPNLHLLATTRAPLRVEGEREYHVEPLPEADAVTLFRERAVASGSDDVIAEICRRLDRLPLAIELAAARTRIFSPEKLLERLGQRLSVLTGGRRDLPGRQRTLRAAIDWSHDLLPPDAQRLFAWLAVFAGSFDIEAAEEVADASTDDLERLVEENLLNHRDDRFFMLETIKEYARERLESSGEADSLRERHARFYLALAERAAEGMEGPSVGLWARRRHRELDNLRAAFSWTMQAGAAEEALRLSIALADVWENESESEEGLRWFARSMRLPPADPHLHARALHEYGSLLMYGNHPGEAIPQLEASVRAWSKIGDAVGLARAMCALGDALAGVDAAAARAILTEVLELSISAKDRAGEQRAYQIIGALARDEREFDQGRRALERSIEVSREMDARLHLGWATQALADLELDSGDMDRAEVLYRECLVNAIEGDLFRLKVACLAGLAAVARFRGRDERAAILWSVVERAEETFDFRIVGLERARYERALDGLPGSNELTPDLDDAVKFALND